MEITPKAKYLKGTKSRYKGGHNNGTKKNAAGRKKTGVTHPNQVPMRMVVGANGKARMVKDGGK